MKIKKIIQSSGERPQLKLNPLVVDEHALSTISNRLLRKTMGMNVVSVSLVEERNFTPKNNYLAKNPQLVFEMELGDDTISRKSSLENIKELLTIELVCHLI